MALTSVSLAEMLRPWRTAGVWFFLDDPSFAVEQDWLLDSSVEEVGTVAPDLDEGTGGEQFPGEEAVGYSPRVAQPAPSATAMTNLTEEDTAVAKKPRSYSSPWSYLSPSEWPQAWQKALPNRRNSLLLWSYPELGLDLIGGGLKERSDCLKQILSYLSMPAGTSVFWPAALPQERAGNRTLEPNIPVFQSGLQYLNPKAVILLGSTVLAMTGLEGDFSPQPFSQKIIRGKLFVSLPDFSQLLGSNSTLEKTKMYLHSVVSPLLASRG